MKEVSEYEECIYESEFLLWIRFGCFSFPDFNELEQPKVVTDQYELFWSSNRLFTVLQGGRNYECGIDLMTIWVEESLNQNSFRIFLTCCLKGSLKSLKINSHSKVAIDLLCASWRKKLWMWRWSRKHLSWLIVE